MPPLLIIIPAHNESATIADIVKRCRAAVTADILVIDDASTDNTALLAEQAGANVVRHLRCMGAWRAMQTGFLYACHQRYQFVVTIDADGQHHPEVISELFAAATSTQQVIIGSNPQRVSLARKFAWDLLRRVSGLKVVDLTSGFRVYNIEALQLMLSKSGALLEFQDLGVLMLLQRHDFQLKEVSVPMSERAFGQSRIFFSWFKVFDYMLSTLVLCLAKNQLGSSAGNRES